jgi:hypothetical protein
MEHLISSRCVHWARALPLRYTPPPKYLLRSPSLFAVNREKFLTSEPPVEQGETTRRTCKYCEEKLKQRKRWYPGTSSQRP